MRSDKTATATSKPGRSKAAEAAAALARVSPVPEETRRREADRKAGKKAAASAALASLPSDIGRGRIMDAPSAAMFWGVSLPHWRRLYRLGRVPAPIKVGERKLGWRVGDLADGLAQRSAGAKAA